MVRFHTVRFRFTRSWHSTIKLVIFPRINRVFWHTFLRLIHLLKFLHLWKFISTYRAFRHTFLCLIYLLKFLHLLKFISTYRVYRHTFLRLIYLFKLSKRYECNSIAFAKALSNAGTPGKFLRPFVYIFVQHTLLYWYTNL